MRTHAGSHPQGAIAQQTAGAARNGNAAAHRDGVGLAG